MSAPESSFKADAALLATFFEKELQECPMLDAYWKSSRSSGATTWDSY